MTTTTDPYAGFGTRSTPQSQQVPGRPEQVKNNAGGFVFEIDPMAQLRRFLTLGTAGGTYYVSQKDLTEENGRMIVTMVTDSPESHKALVDEIVEISVAKRARKPQPAIFALAIACQMGETAGKQYARSKINDVIRTGTHLFMFVKYLKQFGGWSRGLRKAVGNWYAAKDSDKLALQLIKYRNREGFTHRDVLRLTHPKVEGPGKRAAIDWAVGKKTEDPMSIPDFIRFFEMAQAPEADIPGLLRSTYLPWEALPDSAMNDRAVWEIMLDNGMPINALMRQLPRLTNVGIIEPMGGRTADVVAQLTNPEAVKKSGVHPMAVLVALKTYRAGRGMRSTWTPVPAIIDALDDMFYLSFGNVETTGKRIMNALDVSGSMGSYAAGDTNLTAREASAALAMVTVKTEPNHMTIGFTTGRGTRQNYYMSRHESEVTPLPISGRQRLDDVIATVSGLPFGGTDCAQPMIYALHNDLKVDTFVVYTDNETWYGAIHPYQALAQYRKSSGINSKLVVVSLTPSKFSIADPRDPGMLDISGFDAAVPQLITDFSMGRV